MGLGVSDFVFVSHIIIGFSIKSLHFFVSGLDFKMLVSASQWFLDLPFATPCIACRRVWVWKTLKFDFNFLTNIYIASTMELADFS